MRPPESAPIDATTLSSWSRELHLPSELVARLCTAYAPVAARLAERHAARGHPMVVGVSGAQGTGKTTLVSIVTRLLETSHGLKATGLSLDDLYLTRAERTDLSERVHPLLATRGVPGTHDVELGHQMLDALTTGPVRTVVLPSFDKAADDRAPMDQWPAVTAPSEVVLLEGWCVGASPEPDERLVEPINELELQRDPDGIFRRYVNEQLRGPYAELFRRLHELVMLKAPDLECVRRWRREQEHALRRQLARQGRPDTTMDDAAVDRFVQFFERLTVFMFQEMPRRADAVVEIDHEHRVSSVRLSGT